MKKLQSVNIFLILLSCYLNSCIWDTDKEWDVIFPAIPERISTSNSDINVVSYILRQTHEPLFYYKDQGQYGSEVLTRWTKNFKSDYYKMCLKTNLRFNEEKSFKTNDLKNHLDQILADLKVENSMHTSGNCVNISFKKPFAHLYRLLSHIKYAPTTSGKLANTEIGLSDYIISDFTSERVTLTLKEDRKDKIFFEKINVTKFNEDNLPLLKKYEDINRVSFDDQFSKEIKKQFKSYDTTSLVAKILVINHKDKAVRKAIYHCMDIDELKTAYDKNLDLFNYIKYIAPIGFPGAKGGKPFQNCINKKGIENVVFHDWDGSGEKNLKSYFKKLKTGHNIEIKYRKVDRNDFVKSAFVSPHKYNLAVIKIGAKDKTDLFDSLFTVMLPRKNRDSLVDYDLPGLKNLYANFVATTSYEKKVDIFMDLVKLYANEYSFLPLYQPKKSLYYPKNLEGQTLKENLPKISKLFR